MDRVKGGCLGRLAAKLEAWWDVTLGMIGAGGCLLFDGWVWGACMWLSSSISSTVGKKERRGRQCLPEMIVVRT